MTDGGSHDEPNLELPSLFGRRRKKRGQSQPEPEAPVAAAPVKRRPPTPPPSAPPPRAARPEATTELPAVDAPVADAPVAEPDEETRPLAAREAQPTERPPRPTAPPPRRRGPDMTWSPPAADPSPAPVVEQQPEAAPERTRRTRPTLAGVRQRLPQGPSRDTLSSLPLTGRIAAGVTGAVVVLAGVALLWLALQGCTAVRGVSSCGGVGLLAILAVLVVQVLLGGVLLAAWRVSEPRSTSLLGVGLVSTVAMLLLYASTPTVWLSLALLLIGPAAYVVAQGITSSSFRLSD